MFAEQQQFALETVHDVLLDFAAFLHITPGEIMQEIRNRLGMAEARRQLAQEMPNVPLPMTVIEERIKKIEAEAKSKSQHKIDISNLRFYAQMARQFEWQTDIIDWRVIEQTLNEIATRTEEREAENAPKKEGETK